MRRTHDFDRIYAQVAEISADASPVSGELDDVFVALVDSEGV